MLIATAGFGVIASVVVARSVGPAGRGTIVTLTVWGQVLGWLAILSLDKALIVLTSGHRPMVSPEEGLQAARRIVLATSCLAIVASILLGSHFFSNAWLILALAGLAVATAQAELVGSWLLARAHRRAFIVWRLLQPAMYLIILLTLAIFLRTADIRLRTDAMGIGASASMLIPVLVILVYFRPKLRVAARGLLSLLRFAAAAYVGTILQYLNGRLDLLALSFLVSSAGLGYYSVGAALGQLTLVTANAGVVRGITGEAKSTDFIGLAFAGTLAAVVIVSSPLVIPLVFGQAFVPAVPIARILAIGGVANYALQGASGRLLARRLPWMVVLSQGLGVAVFVSGIAIFRTLQGVAWASVVSFVVSLLVAHAALRITDEH
jgi:O-antigen/teichoic acid export membrane protein